jgi:hypothetical protein
MNDDDRSSKMLSDDALERVMLDMFGGAWDSPQEKASQESAKRHPSQYLLTDEDEGEI